MDGNIRSKIPRNSDFEDENYEEESDDEELPLYDEEENLEINVGDDIESDDGLV